MFWRMLGAVLALPVMVVLVVPAALYYLLPSLWGAPLPIPPLPALASIWLGLLLIALGLVLGVWTASLFVARGKGTPAPWDPPRRLVVRGPYRHMRNPMMSGVFAFLLGEAMVLHSWPLLAWFALFTAGNALYIPLWEEPRLRRRFGPAYLQYLKEVPRWLPRLRPWQGPKAD